MVLRGLAWYVWDEGVGCLVAGGCGVGEGDAGEVVAAEGEWGGVGGLDLVGEVCDEARVAEVVLGDGGWVVCDVGVDGRGAEIVELGQFGDGGVEQVGVGERGEVWAGGAAEEDAEEEGA